MYPVTTGVSFPGLMARTDAPYRLQGFRGREFMVL